MGRFDGVLMCTDLDGTLFGSDRAVSEENVSAIAFFMREGGRFTFVTGRMPSFSDHVCDIIHPNAPFGCVNGGGLYDHVKREYIWTNELRGDVVELIECVDRELPAVGIQVNTFHKVYFCKENDTMSWFREVTGLPNYVCHYGEVKEPLAKIVFGSEDESEILKLEKLLRTHPRAADFDFVRSEDTLFEILPKGSGKGNAITELARYLQIDVARTVAIGDYNNDISMFHAAGLGIAVSNACPEALEAADAVTVSNDEHAIARVICDLAEGKYRL